MCPHLTRNTYIHSCIQRIKRGPKKGWQLWGKPILSVLHSAHLQQRALSLGRTVHKMISKNTHALQKCPRSDRSSSNSPCPHCGRQPLLLSLVQQALCQQCCLHSSHGFCFAETSGPESQLSRQYLLCLQRVRPQYPRGSSQHCNPSSGEAHVLL